MIYFGGEKIEGGTTRTGLPFRGLTAARWLTGEFRVSPRDDRITDGERNRGEEREALEWTARHFCTIIEINEGKKKGREGIRRAEERAEFKAEQTSVKETATILCLKQRATLKTNEGNRSFVPQATRASFVRQMFRRSLLDRARRIGPRRRRKMPPNCTH